MKILPTRFVFDIDATPEERRSIAARILWLKRRSVRAESDKREHKRTLPHDARSTIILADGRMLRGVLIDISRSGAALSADVVPALGEPIMIGRVPARVVRLLKVGFAVQFDEVQPAEQLEQRLAAFEARRGSRVAVLLVRAPTAAGQAVESGS